MPLNLVFQAQAKFQLKFMATGEHMRSSPSICGQFGSNKVFFKKKSRATGYDIITIGAEK